MIRIKLLRGQIFYFKKYNLEYENIDIDSWQLSGHVFMVCKDKYSHDLWLRERPSDKSVWRILMGSLTTRTPQLFLPQPISGPIFSLLVAQILVFIISYAHPKLEPESRDMLNYSYLLHDTTYAEFWPRVILLVECLE